MPTLSTREPLAIRAAVVAAVDALIHTAVSFGLDLSTEQTASLSTTVNLLSILAVVLWSRGKVTPVDDPDLAASEAYAERVAAEPAPAPMPEPASAPAVEPVEAEPVFGPSATEEESLAPEEAPAEGVEGHR